MLMNVETCISWFTIESYTKSLQSELIHSAYCPIMPSNSGFIHWSFHRICFSSEYCWWICFDHHFERLGLSHDRTQQTGSFLWSLVPHTGATSWRQTYCLWNTRVFVIPLIRECRYHTPLVNLWSEAGIPLALENICCLTQKLGIHETTSVKGLPKKSCLLMP